MTSNTQDQVQDHQPEQIDVPALQAEVERLRTHSAELLADLKAERRAHHATKDELKAALGGEQATWKQRYHQEAVLAPLENELRGVAAVPVEYLQSILVKTGLLKLESDKEGIERPRWYTPDGEPADMSLGLHAFLSGVYDKNPDAFLDLGRAIRGSGTTGGGASGSIGGGGYTLPQKAAPFKPNASPAMPVGLR